MTPRLRTVRLTPAEMGAGGFAYRDVMEFWTGDSFALDICGPDHVPPLLSFFGDELGEVRRRDHQRGATQVGEPRLDLRIGKRGIDLAVELVDDLSRRVLGRADTLPTACLIA